MRRGENWALPRKDQGPVRALARDYVDSRRSASEYYMFGVLLLVVLLFIPGLRQSAVIDYAVLALLLVIVLESSIVGGRVIKLAHQRFPDESTRGCPDVRGHPRHPDPQAADALTAGQARRQDLNRPVPGSGGCYPCH